MIPATKASRPASRWRWALTHLVGPAAILVGLAVLGIGVYLWSTQPTFRACIPDIRGATQALVSRMLTHCRSVADARHLGIWLTIVGALVVLLGGIAVAAPFRAWTGGRSSHARPPAGPATATSTKERRDPRGSARWMTRQAVMVMLALAALGIGALLLVHGVTQWFDGSGPQACAPAHPASIVSQPRPVCRSFGPWRNGSLQVTFAGTVLTLFGLGVVPAALRRDKRRFWFRGGTWVRVPPVGSLPH
jgi:hypothetical protein